MQEFVPIIEAMMRDPPDPNEVVPLANRRKVAIGVVLPFLVLSWIAVALRLHTRLHIVRQPGWDDAFVTIAAVFNVVAQIAFIGGIENGIGQHLIHILGILPTAMKWFYVANAAYTTTTICIKLSLLCQYLRLFQQSYLRLITIILLVTVCLWGGTFSFLAWFPCFPIRGFWDKSMVPPAKCYAFGYRTTTEAKTTLLAFAGTNLSLDVVVFLVPLSEYLQPNLKRKQVLAMTGLFAIGSIVVLMAVLRLWSGLKYNHRGVLKYDWTFWLPEVLIFSCLEVDFAIMCASMPIFWPTVKAAWNQIYITQEVIVTHESCNKDDGIDKYDMDIELDGKTSLRSHCSTDGLMVEANMSGKSFFLNDDGGPRLVPATLSNAHTTQVSRGRLAAAP